MQFYRRHKKFITVSGVTIMVTGTGWIAQQIYKTHNTLYSMLDTSIIDFMEPSKYIDNVQPDDGSFILPSWVKTYDDKIPKTHGWNFLKFSYAKRLLNMSNSDDRTMRRRAIRELAQISNLNNWQYSLLAHLIQADMAVALARTTDVDLRFFLKIKNYKPNDHNFLVEAMKNFLIKLNSRARHSCMEYFINSAFTEDPGRYADYDLDSTQLNTLIRTSDLLTVSLEPLLHHSSLKDYAKDIIELNGLPLLMQIYNQFPNNKEVKMKMCDILANISVYPNVLEEIFQTGWIGVLAELVKDTDIRISSTAAKVLANLDRDDDYHATYPRQVYVLHPLLRSDSNTDVDVVFVHGLLGGVFFTWRQRTKNELTLGFLGKRYGKETFTTDATARIIRSSDPAMQEYIDDLSDESEAEWNKVGHDFEFVLNDIPVHSNEHATGFYSCPGSHECIQEDIVQTSSTNCWPKDWLPNDCQSLRVIGINYDTSLSLWASMCPIEHAKTTLEERSDEFLTKLVKAGVGQRPIVWVTHSMGGLLVKNILVKAWESGSKDLQNMCSNTKGIVFYSTPHVGSRLATLSQATALVLWPSVEIQELKEESPALIHMHDKFLKVARSFPMKIVSFVETKSTTVTAMKFNFVLVDTRSGNPDVGEYFEVPQDHLGICKPANRQSFLYQKVLHLIKEIVEGS